MYIGVSVYRCEERLEDPNPERYGITRYNIKIAMAPQKHPQLCSPRRPVFGRAAAPRGSPRARAAAPPPRRRRRAARRAAAAAPGPGGGARRPPRCPAGGAKGSWGTGGQKPWKTWEMWPKDLKKIHGDRDLVFFWRMWTATTAFIPLSQWLGNGFSVSSWICRTINKVN